MAKTLSAEPQLEIKFFAAIDGHDLTAVEPLAQPGRIYRARCIKRQKTVWVGKNLLIDSVLSGTCLS